MKVSQAIADALVLEGTEYVFGVMGDGNMDLMTELDARGTRIIATRHEQGAVAMADGYARVAGKPGVATVTQGPGLTQTGTALVTARLHRSPVVVLAGDAPIGDRQHLQKLDQKAFAECTAGAFLPLRLAATTAEDLALAFRHVRLGGGPVVLSARGDIQESDVDGPWSARPSTSIMPQPQRPAPDPALLDRAAHLVGAAERPVIIAGRGAVEARAGEELERLADSLGAPLATTLSAKDYFRRHPLSIGIAGGYSDELAEKLFAEADLIISVGASLNTLTTRYGRLFPNAKLIQIDVRPDGIGTGLPVDIGIVGDAQVAVRELRERLLGDGREAAPWPPADVMDRMASPRAPFAGPYLDSDEGLDPRHVACKFDELLPQDRVVISDSGHMSRFICLSVSVPAPEQFVFTGDFGAVGLGLAQGIGAALAAVGKTCVAFVGDGSLMMSLEELDTAVRYGVRLVVIVMNDRAYGSEYHQLKLKGKPTDLALFDNPDLADVARALGAAALTIRQPADFSSLARAMVEAGGPLLVDVRVNRNVRSPSMEGLFAAVAREKAKGAAKTVEA